MNNIDPKFLEMLQVLALKLGTTVEHLWIVLTRQGRVDAYVSMVGVIVGITLLVVASKVVKRAFQLYGERIKTNGYSEREILDNKLFVNTVVGCSSYLLGILFILTNFMSMVTGFLNPEYFALKQLLSLFK